MGHDHPHGPRRPLRSDHRLPLEKFFRDAKIYQLFEGTAQVQRLVIARLQRSEYQQRLEATTEVADQNGTKIGDVVREAAATLSTG